LGRIKQQRLDRRRADIKAEQQRHRSPPDGPKPW
jgi:hypothetical protein